ncbi:NBS-LRR-like resistance protein [Rhynchospora pubera]|uniref:NBS-LRR-like resistance protein n=1 Tax=Rhynchospora pubera TaxID=906938 RepID=A0AAV8HTZ0_9POAL|nr:NBS-LRR-like resistance protein [Rhynchospora pubera]
MGSDIFLYPLISLAVNKARDALIEQICQKWGVDDDRKTLVRYLLTIQKKIQDVQQMNHPVRQWMEEVDAAVQQVVDVLNEFRYEALHCNAIGEDAASLKVMKHFFSSKNTNVIRSRMRNKLTKALRKVAEIVSVMNNFNLILLDPAVTIDRETFSFVVESEVIGREIDKEKIVRELMDPQRNRDNISVLAIVGMPGMGKTTLAQLVFNDARVKEHFQLLLWVCVSTEFTVINILKSIIIQASYRQDTIALNKEALQRELGEILGRKRYLLVLDDVWNDSLEKWEELRNLLFSKASSGSVIIVTTSNQRVASIMGTLPSHDLARLTEEHAWGLFEKYAFGAWDEDPTEVHSKFCRTIVQKCVGVPLVVKSFADLVRTKRDLRDWHTISKINILDYLLDETFQIFSIVKFSYDGLPSHVKQCFAFCAIFPIGYEIKRETLIQLWMANDLISTDGSMENLENKGRSIFNELCWRFFFQNIKEEEGVYGSITTCKMHEIMHGFARRITGNKCGIMQGVNDPTISQEVRHLHYRDETEFLGINNVLMRFPNIHTYLGPQAYNIQIEEQHSDLPKSSSLRALRFESKHPLKELGYMKHIKYLDLSYGNFTTLPETISTLYSLQTLNLSHSNIQELPTEMSYMINLRHLILNGCDFLKCMPIGFGQLKSLQTLTNYVLTDSRSAGSIIELNQLNFLSGQMSLSGLESVRDIEDAQIVNLAAKKNLSSLELHWGPSYITGERGNDQPVLEALAPHNELKYLSIYGYSGFKFPKWMMEALILRKLKRLTIHDCINCGELPPLWKLPLLEKLYLCTIKSLIYIVGGTEKQVEGSGSSITFPALKVLKVQSLPNLEGWHKENSESVGFPELNELFIYNCPRLKSLPVHGSSLSILKVEYSSNIKLL